MHLPRLVADAAFKAAAAAVTTAAAAAVGVHACPFERHILATIRGGRALPRWPLRRRRPMPTSGRATKWRSAVAGPVHGTATTNDGTAAAAVETAGHSRGATAHTAAAADGVRAQPST